MEPPCTVDSPGMAYSLWINSRRRESEASWGEF
ncbi:MAG: hypothetical protein ACI8W8_004273, partial [Rhodothermales bacterium]